MTAQGWTEEMVGRLRALWADHSASECAAELKVTRNAVVGKVFRLGLSSEPANANRAARVSQSRSFTRGDSPMRVIRLRKPAASKPTVPNVCPSPLNTPLSKLRAVVVECRWVTDDSDAREPRYCGHPVHGSTSWCVCHLAIVSPTAVQQPQQVAA